MHEGREQGADMGSEVVYTREFEGEHQERRAYTPADVVNLEARGWRRRESNQEKPAQRVEAPKAVVPSASTSAPAPKPAAPAAGESA